MIEFVLVVLGLIVALVFLVNVWGSNHKMHLVKDSRSGVEEFYWESLDSKRLSPVFSKLSDAKHWWLAQEFSRFKGTERRKQLTDRRYDAKSRKDLDEDIDVLNPTNAGRRKTDIPIVPDVER